jgi:hypothetical protein
MIVTPILADDVDIVWPKVVRWIAKACFYSEGTQTTADVYRRVKEEGDTCLFIVDKCGVTVWEKDGDWLHATIFAGDNILAQMDEIVNAWAAYAHLLGCKGLSCKGRRGWSRVLSRYGFTRSEDNELRALL